MIHRSKLSPNGFTLVELLLALIAGSSIMALGIGVVHQSFHWSKQCRDRAATVRHFDRLQRQFRSDVHVAESIKLQNDSLSLESADGQVVYQVESNRLVRTNRSADKILQREYYPLQLGEAFNLSMQVIKDPDRACLTFRRRTPLKETVAPSLVVRDIQAVVGFSQRHGNPQAMEDVSL